MEDNGYDTAVVTLVTDDVGEGEKNLYWTPAGVRPALRKTGAKKPPTICRRAAATSITPRGGQKRRRALFLMRSSPKKRPTPLAEGAQHQYYTAGAPRKILKRTLPAPLC